MDLHLKDKVVIVSGGAKGIGVGIVKALAAEGAIPVIVGRNENDNQVLLKRLLDNGQKGDAVTAELSQPEECEKAVQEVMKK